MTIIINTIIIIKNYKKLNLNILPETVLKAYNMTKNELNNSLSTADKKILDHIVKAVTINNKEFISRLFL